MNGDFSTYSDKEAYRIANLIAGYVKGTLSETEHQELDDWVCISNDNLLLFERLTDEKNIGQIEEWIKTVDTEKALEQIKQSERFRAAAVQKSWKRFIPYQVAASVLLITGLFVFKPFGKKNLPAETAIQQPADISPGSNKASLTLADGKIILLGARTTDTSVNDDLKILHQGEIVYRQASVPHPLEYHTLTVPKKGTYKLELPDGTKVWLNAASSIRYPVAFEQTERKVFISGEVYFEVAKDKTKPFRVVAGNVMVEALGTAFNVSAYPDDSFISATLAEGSVRVSEGKVNNILKPGQQAKITNKDFTVTDVETEEAIAWKNNRFRFVNAPLDEIMKQIARWYDAEIVYTKMPSDHFNADISKDVPVSKLLHYLELTKSVQFRIEGNRIIVQ